MRKLLFICFSLAISTAQAQQSNTATAPVHYKETGDPLPPILLYTTSGKKITNADLKNKANLLVMIFNPNCGHCENATEMLEKNIGLFKKSKLLMVANANQAPYLKSFEERFHIEQYPTISLGIDSNLHLIDKTFQYKMLPQISVYDKKRKLVKVFTGDIVIDSLKPYIQ